MPDRVSVTSSQSWFSRLGESIKSVVFGVVLFIVAFPVLFWNEGRAVKTARSLSEGSGLVVSVSPDAVDRANDGKLVHVSAFTATDDVLVDETFGVSENAIQLARHVEMYQWVEEESSTSETKLGGSKETTTTYEYSTRWKPSLIDSTRFHSPGGHENPNAMRYESRTERAANVSLGAYALSASQIADLDKSEPLRLSSLLGNVPGAKLHDGHVYIGADPASPSVGDTRVEFTVVRPGPVSVVAQQAGSSFSPYQAKAGGQVFLLQEAIVSADAMFETAQRSNAVMTWVLRGVGFFMMFFGLSMVFAPIAVFGDVVPIVGRLLGAGTSIVAGFIAAFFAIGTIAVAWIAYRPVLGVVLLLLAAGAVYLLVRVARKRSAASGPPPIPRQRPVEAD